ncbi:pilus assembly FimT family protein [Shewanella marina]|uniref:pilus assembly FimT family protein n=1 Tax=Shewanella marina TaxID=487319 RepID=UPI0004701B45|nr:type II secretion system protein [Shewanella marina]
MKTNSSDDDPKHKQHGFTLIELVAVIAILGILAVTAAAHFIDLPDNAISADINALAGSIKQVTQTIYDQAVIENTANQAYSNTHNIQLAYGYPIAGTTGIVQALQQPNSWHSYTGSYLLGHISVFTYKEIDGVNNGKSDKYVEQALKTQCFVMYNWIGDNQQPQILATTTDEPWLPDWLKKQAIHLFCDVIGAIGLTPYIPMCQAPTPIPDHHQVQPTPDNPNIHVNPFGLTQPEIIAQTSGC